MHRIPLVPFGTAGFRGPMKEGLDGLNLETVLKFAQATALSLKDCPSLNFVISYDCRHHSKEFAHAVATVFSGNGFTVHLTDTLMPTPYLSFLCHHLKCAGGIMITASHNPSGDNGVKIYEGYGGQFIDHEKKLLENVQKNAPVKISYENIHFVDKKMVDDYFQQIIKVLPTPFDATRKDLKIVYSPFNGCGSTVIPEFLRRTGFTSFTLVPEQTPIDPDFAGFKKPNPEDPANLHLIKAMMNDLDADLGFGTDPDSDRIAFVDRHTMFTGNRIGAIVLESLLREGKQGDVHTSFVSTNLVDAIAKKYGRKVHRYKTGFRYISEALVKNPDQFLMGFEESIGYLIVKGGSVDKDAPHMALYVAQLANQLKKKNMTLTDFSHELDQLYGFFREDQVSIELKEGETGSSFVETKVVKPEILQIGGLKVLKKELHPDMGITLFQLEALQILIRPSGTEPKVKFYIKLGPFKGTEGEANELMRTISSGIKTTFKN
ncbi:MAG: phospho-sugar mutase [Chlamydiia bacterium]